MITYEVWKLSDESVIRCPHAPERRRHFQLPSDLLIGTFQSEVDSDTSEPAQAIYIDFLKTKSVQASAKDFLSDSYVNGLNAGDKIRITDDVDLGSYFLPVGTILVVDQGDLDFPDTLYATTVKWPKGKGTDHHIKMVMLTTRDFNHTYVKK